MPYTIKLTNGQQLTVVQDGQLDTTTSLTLAGANYVGYGQFINENFIYLLENGANNTGPADPLKGQLWYNTNTKALSVYDGTAFKALPTVVQAQVQPTTGNYGDFWWDNLNYQLYVWSDGWQLVGPLYQQSMGVTGAIPTRIWDTNTPSVYHDCITIQTGTDIGAIIHTGHSSFTPNPSISGFTIIRPGINLNTSYTNLFNGTSTNSQLLGGLAPSAFYQLNTDLSTSGNINTTNYVTVGSSLDGKFFVDSNVNIASTTKGITVKVAGGTALYVNPLNALTTVPADPVTGLGIATKQYVDTASANLQAQLNSNVNAINNNIGANVIALTAQINALQTAFNSNIASINAQLATMATTSYVSNSILAAMPVGIITIWKGTASDIPANWHLCDGTNGTPDFRDKFIVAAGSTYPVNTSGGAAAVTLSSSNMPAHTHTYSGTITATGTGTTGAGGAHVHGLSDPGHSHIYPGDDQLGYAAGYAGWGGASAGGFPYDAHSNYGGGAQMWYTTVSSSGISMTSIGDHSHTFSASLGASYSGTTSQVGSGTSFNILPPYYAKCFIMKIA